MGCIHLTVKMYSSSNPSRIRFRPFTNRISSMPPPATPPTTQTTTGLFPVSIIPFQECYVNGMIETLWNWRFSLSIILWRLSQVAACTNQVFLFLTERSVAWCTVMCFTTGVLKDIWLYKCSFKQHSYTGFCVEISFHFVWTKCLWVHLLCCKELHAYFYKTLPNCLLACSYIFISKVWMDQFSCQYFISAIL